MKIALHRPNCLLSGCNHPEGVDASGESETAFFFKIFLQNCSLLDFDFAKVWRIDYSAPGVATLECRHESKTWDAGHEKDLSHNSRCADQCIGGFRC